MKVPGLSNIWVPPIRNRIDMLATGIKSPVGIKVAGQSLPPLTSSRRKLSPWSRTPASRQRWSRLDRRPPSTPTLTSRSGPIRPLRHRRAGYRRDRHRRARNVGEVVRAGSASHQRALPREIRDTLSACAHCRSSPKVTRSCCRTSRRSKKAPDAAQRETPARPAGVCRCPRPGPASVARNAGRGGQGSGDAGGATPSPGPGSSSTWNATERMKVVVPATLAVIFVPPVHAVPELN